MSVRAATVRNVNEASESRLNRSHFVIRPIFVSIKTGAVDLRPVAMFAVQDSGFHDHGAAKALLKPGHPLHLRGLQVVQSADGLCVRPDRCGTVRNPLALRHNAPVIHS